VTLPWLLQRFAEKVLTTIQGRGRVLLEVAGTHSSCCSSLDLRWNRLSASAFPPSRTPLAANTIEEVRPVITIQRAICAAFLFFTSHAHAAAQTDAALVRSGLVGLPVVSSDGEQIGHVALVVSDESGPLILAEVSRPLGIGSTPITLHAETFIDHGYRVELVATAAQVRAKLGSR
jgi:hypothetical protein